MKNRKRKPLDRTSRLLRLKLNLSFRIFKRMYYHSMILAGTYRPKFSDSVIHKATNQIDFVPTHLTQFINN